MNINTHTYDAVIVGGGPSGATAANDLARLGHHIGHAPAVEFADGNDANAVGRRKIHHPH